MFRLVEHLGFENILELGTSLGISTLYLASANKTAEVYTLEGDTGSYSMATHIFHKLKMKNIKAKLGVFQETLAPTLREMKKVDLAFIDGHHDESATLNYFETIKPYCGESSAIIIDDIYWSAGMQNAWKKIQNMTEVTLTIDLFFCGIVFFRKEQKEKEHFKIRPDQILFHR
jgi:predicted O-methyltransferase YrrM